MRPTPNAKSPLGGLYLLDKERRAGGCGKYDESDLEWFVKREQVGDAIGKQRHEHEVRHQREDHQRDVLERPDDLGHRQTQARAQHAGYDEQQTG